MSFTKIAILLALAVHTLNFSAAELGEKKSKPPILRKNTVEQKEKGDEYPDSKDTPSFSSKIELLPPVPGRFVVLKKFSSNANKPFRGLLIKTGPNSKIVASSEGMVVAVEKLEGYENMIVLEHPNNYLTIYANLGEVLVKEGDKVLQGMELGTTLNEKNLYFQVNRGERSLDPTDYILSEK